MKNVGIITYHAAYNYGSVLQALATQETVEKLGHRAQIINYRMEEQRKFYSLYRTKFGYKTLIKDLLQLPIQSKRKKRENAFEEFISAMMNLSEEFSNPKDINKRTEAYEVLLSGSDQIWNKHSCEFEHNEWLFMDPYLFKGCENKKISYASSIAQMSDEELEIITPALQQIEHIAMREKESAERMENILNRKIDVVLDPTFLLNKNDWIELLGIQYIADSDYILYYSLDGINDMRKRINPLIQYAQNHSLKLRIVTPYSYLPCREEFVELHPEYGPLEFISALINAKMVITDSYHGTILSINFGKDVYSLCKNGGAEFRKTDILSRVGMIDRAIFDIDDLNSKEFDTIDYNKVHAQIEGLRKGSKKYLADSINN